MTVSQQAYLDSLNRRRQGEPRSLAGSLAWQIQRSLESRRQLTFPCTQFDRPGGIKDFANTVLGIRVSKIQEKLFKQVEEACDANADIKRIVVQACVKAGKSHTMAILALWRYCCVVDSRTVFTAVREDSVNKIVWAEIVKMFHRSGVCLDCRKGGAAACEHSAKIPGKLAGGAGVGLKGGIGFAEVFGVVSASVEGLQGISDPTLMIIGDEAVGIRDQYFEALSGNMVSSVTGCEIWFANPNKTGGWYHRACTENVARWRHVKIAASDVWDEGIPGLMSRKEAQKILDDYGPESDSYRIRVLGEFPLGTSGGLFTATLFEQAKSRFETKRGGFVVVGIDPASSGGAGDATGFAVRVDDSVQYVTVEYGLEPATIYAKACQLAAQYTSGDYMIAYDRTGSVGYEFHTLINAKRKQNPKLTTYPLNFSDASPVQGYRRLRDFLVENVRKFLRFGSINDDNQEFEEEAMAFSFETDVKGKSVATAKPQLRRALGRSPDYFDAVSCAVYPVKMPVRRAAPAHQRPDYTQRTEMNELQALKNRIG